jgi:hypothetical protein
METTSDQAKAWAMQWKAAGPALRRQRHRDIRRQNNATAIEALSDLSNYHRKRAKSRMAEGFVQMYKVLGWKPGM